MRPETFLAAFAAVALLAGAAAAEPPGDPAHWRKVDPENLLQLTIKRQNVLIELRPDFAPGHVAQVRKITRDGNYDALPFHRVIDDFMAQGGEVSAVYMLSTPYPRLQAEFTFGRKASAPVRWAGDPLPSGIGYGLYEGFVVASQPDAYAMVQKGGARTYALHCPGIASMARTDDPNSADTQYFLMRQANEGLDAKYTVWGRALVGLDVIRSIKAGPEDTDGRMAPAVADKLTRAVILADVPEASRPSVWVMRDDAPDVVALLGAARAADPAQACALPPVPVHVEMPANG